MPISLQSCLNFFAPLGLLCCNVYHCADINFYYTARNVELLHHFSPLFKFFLSSVSMRCMLDFVFHLFLTACTVCFYSFIIRNPCTSLSVYFKSILYIRVQRIPFSISWGNPLVWVWVPALNSTPQKEFLSMRVKLVKLSWWYKRWALLSAGRQSWCALPAGRGQPGTARPSHCAQPCWECGLSHETTWLWAHSWLPVTVGLQNESLSWASIMCYIPFWGRR